MEELITPCADCGSETPTDVNYNMDGNSICKGCHDANYMHCEYSGTILKISEAIEIVIDGVTKKVHSRLADLFVQTVCGKWMQKEQAFQYRGDYYDRNNLDDSFFTCAYSGELTPNEEAIDWEGETYSRRGYGNKRDLILNYSYKPEPIFHKLKHETNDRNDRLDWRSNPIFLGLELEMENSGEDSDSYCAAETQDILGDAFYLKSDSSIDSGFEAVSHPMTYQYLRKNVTKQKFEAIESLDLDGDTYNCGMHVHVPRNVLNPLGWWKVSMMMVKCQKHFIEFSRREERRISQYAEMPKMSGLYRDIENIEQKGNNCPEMFGRGAMNFSNSNTVEFRLWAGTSTHEHFKNTARMVEQLVEFAKVYGYAFFMKNDGLALIKEFIRFCSKQGLQHFVEYIKLEKFKPQSQSTSSNAVVSGSFRGMFAA